MAPSSAPSRGLPLDALRERLRAALGEELLVADDAGVARYARDDGAEGPFPPGLVVRPRERAQVAELVALCHELGVPLSPRGVGHRDREAAGVEQRAHAQSIRELERGRDHAAGLTAVHCGAGVDLVGEAGEQGQRGGGLRDQAQGAGGGHRERALGADQQAGEVVAGDALDRAVTDAQWFAGAGDDVEAEHEVAGDAVLARPRAAGVGRDVAAEAALLPARRVGRVEQAAGLGRVLQGRVDHPRLDLREQRALVDVEDAVQTGEVEHDAAVVREAAADRAGARAARALLWIEIDGDAAGLDASIRRAAQHCRDAGALDVSLAGDPATRARLWDVRRALSHTLRARWPKKISEDVAVPLAQLPALASAARELGARHGLDVASFGHAGDGNLHVNILYDPAAGPDVAARVDRAVADLFRVTIALGGTLSGEHGIGISKRPFMPLEQSAPLRALQLALKRVWDPRNILNPGKLFPA